ncbi:MAG: 4Fe-4S binding protein [Candidatus Thorarchaeota archaeon]
MVQKGQIFAWNSSTGRRYALTVFLGGIWEGQIQRMDREFAQLMEDYFDKGRGVGHFHTEPAVFRVIPVNRAITPELEVYPFEVAENIVQGAKSWGLRECMCKKQLGVLDQDCEYPTSVCLLISSRPGAYDDDALTKPISKEESLDILLKAEEAGLIHCSSNVQQGHSYICNCCTCCCAMLRGLVQLGQPHAFVNSNFQASVEQGACAGCGDCVVRCQFDALSLVQDICQVDNSRCVGCGVCSIACPENALRLVSRDSAERKTPPESRTDWNTRRAISRGLDMSDLL